MIKRLTVLLFAAVAATGCSSPSQTFDIDNPGDTPLTLRIDGNELPIAAHASRPVKLRPGEHHLQTPALGEVRFIVYARGQGGLINPTLGEYVIASAVHAGGEDTRENVRAPDQRITLGGVTFNGPYRKTHALFIDQAWTFGVREPLPDAPLPAHVDAPGDRGDSKIFTAPDFIAHAQAGSADAGARGRPRAADYQPPVHTLQPAPAALPALDPALEAHAGPLRELYARYLKATTADAQLQLQQESAQAQMAFTAATARLRSTLPVQANAACSRFLHTRSALMGSAVLVVP